MSEKTKKSAKSVRKYSELDNDLVTFIPESKNQKKIHFPEWVDEEINVTSTTSIVPHFGKHKASRSEKADEFSKPFEDPQVQFLPFCLQDLEHDWKRPSDVFPDYQLVIYTNENDFSDLLTSSNHLVKSTFVRSFISSIHNLEYLARTTNFSQESTTSRYYPNAHGYWRPWHHVYGTSKVGEGTTHNPQVNKAGRYSVRLYWLGAWRKVVIDDYLPVDITGHVLLPSLPIPKKGTASNTHIVAPPQEVTKAKGKQKSPRTPEKDTSKPIVVLWPFLLSKALLKLANLTMRKDIELLDFHIVECLTGWVPQKVKLDGMSADDVWEICRTYTKQYSWEEKEETTKSIAESKHKKETAKVPAPKRDESQNSYCLFALCRDMRSLKQNGVNGLSPCWGHEMIFEESRDIPFERPPPEPEYPLWKKFRWTEWAKSRGIISEYVPMDTTRYLRCVAPFRKFSKLVVHKEEPVEKVPAFPLRTNLKIFPKQQIPAQSKSEEDDKSLRSKEKKMSQVPSPDLSFWLRFDEIFLQLVSLYVYFKPSFFRYKSRVSDMVLNGIVTRSSQKFPWKDVTWPNTLEDRGNIPLYIFMDSLESKSMMVNLSQSGDLERVLPLEDELDENNFFVEYERLFGDKNESPDDTEVVPPKKLKLNRPRIHAELKRSNVIFEEFGWQNPENGKLNFFLDALGSRSSMLELGPGRYVLRVWIKSEFSYCLTILSDTKFTLGCFELILDELAEEPMRFTQLALNISGCFAKLLQSFGTPEVATRQQEYHRSYLPKDAMKELSKKQREILHQAFQRSLSQYVQSMPDQATSEKQMEALRILFLDRIFCVHKQLDNPTTLETLQFESFEERIICGQAATKLKSFFKRVQMRQLLAKRNPNSRHFIEVFDTLKSLYANVFSLSSRNECLGTIMRNFFRDDGVSEFIDSYEVSGDFEWDVTIQTYSGTSEMQKDYVVLTRFTLRCRTHVCLVIRIFCNVTNSALRVIDNDTGEEVYRFTNYLYQYVFKPNSFGYTVVGFAWNVEITAIRWKLAVISYRNTGAFFEMEEIKTVTTSSFEHYMPICRDLIGKHLIYVGETVVFTLRFSSSYDKAKFNVRLYDPEGKLMVDVVGVERIILPSVLLKYVAPEEPQVVPKTGSSRSLDMSRSSYRYVRQDDKRRTLSKKESLAARKTREMNELISFSENEPQIYILEFHVLDKSWPLTKNEWENVKRLREETYFFNAYYGTYIEHNINDELTSKDARKPSRPLKRSTWKKVQEVEKPWYLLQYSFKTNAQVYLAKDKTELDKILELKKSWYQNDPKRYTKSLELRQKYLERYIDPGCQCPEEFLNTSRTSEVPSEISLTLLGLKNGDDEEDVERTTKSPKWTEADIPPFDLSPYYRSECLCPLDFRTMVIKTEKDHMVTERERQEMIAEYTIALENRKANMELWINESNERRALLFLWYADCRKASEEIYHENHVMRQNFLEKWAEELAPHKKPTEKDKKLSQRK